MKYKLSELIDIPMLQALFDSLNDIYPLPSAVIDIESNVLTATAWQDICTKFHRINPETEKKCKESDAYIGKELDKSPPHIIFKCPMGLVDSATPIIIDGEHLGNVFTGQLLLEHPNVESFKKKAKQYGFDEKAYLDALKKVPVITEDTLKKNLKVLANLTKMLADIGLQQKKQKESEEMFLKAFHSDPSLRSITRLNDGKILNVNDAFANTLGYSQDELIGKTTQELNIWADQTQRKEMMDVVKKEGKFNNFEVQVKTKSGEIRTILFSAEIIDIGKKPILLSSGNDITERKLADEKLKGNEQLLKEAQRIGKLGSLDWNVNTNELILSNEALEIYGLAKEKKKHTLEEITSLLHPDDREQVEISLQNAISGRAKHDMEHRMVRSDGNVIYIQATAELLRDTEGKPVRLLGTILDITNRKQLEEERLKLQKLDSVGVLAGGIAHDFNNQLASILMLSNTAKLSLSSYKESETYKVLEEVEKSVNNAKKLTQQLLTFSKGGIPIKNIFSLSHLIKDSVRLALSGTSVKSKLLVADKLWFVYADEGQINQVINNLAINACHAMPEGGAIEVRAENVTISEGEFLKLKKGKYILIQIEDSGIGIAEEHLSKIFDPFFSTKQQGSGLGLATAYSIIKKHDGLIRVDSKLKKGTTFSVYLPASEKTLDEKGEDEEILYRGRGRVLVMDDDEMVIMGCSKLLDIMGYEFDSAIDGKEAIEKYEKAKEYGKPFDVVILDLTVPGGMGGRETMKILLEKDPEVKAIVSSGYVDNIVIEKYRDYGFKSLLTKPYNAETMSKVLHEVISGTDA